MASVNKVILIGNVGNDPEVRYLDRGVAIATFNLATTERGYVMQNGTQVPVSPSNRWSGKSCRFLKRTTVRRVWKRRSSAMPISSTQKATSAKKWTSIRSSTISGSMVTKPSFAGTNW